MQNVDERRVVEVGEHWLGRHGIGDVRIVLALYLRDRLVDEWEALIKAACLQRQATEELMHLT